VGGGDEAGLRGGVYVLGFFGWFIYGERIAPRRRMPRTAEIEAGRCGWGPARHRLVGRLCRAFTPRRTANDIFCRASA
jgi:hypothetical protein